MERLGNVNISGLSLSGGMRADLAGGMSASAFNSKYAGGGFKPIALSRQLGAAPAPAPAAPAPAQPLRDFAAEQKTAQDALLVKQNKEQEGLFGNYEAIRKNQEALPALYNRLQTEAGIPELGQQAQTFKNEIYKTKGQLDRLSEDVTARTTGYNVSDAQRRRLEASEGSALQTNLGRLGTGLEPVADMLRSANESVGTQLTLNTQQQDRELEPVKMRINAISDRFAREITGFNSNKELTLTALLDDIQRGRQLADRDWELAQTLAAEERSFSRQKSLATMQLSTNNLGGGGGGNTPAPVPTRPTVDQYAKSGVVAGNFAGSLGYTGNKLDPSKLLQPIPQAKPWWQK